MKANATKINKADLASLKKRLLEQEALLVSCLKGELDSLAYSDRNLTADDVAQDTSAQDVQAGLGENASAELINIREALRRIDSPEFGVCDICDKPIAVQRLKAIPHVSTCLKCQTELEKRR